jgi:uncharacterized protein YkwD
VDLTRPPDDPDLRLLRRDAVRRQQRRRCGNVAAGVLIGTLALANVAVAGPVLGMTSVGEVAGVDGFGPFGRDDASPGAEAADLPRAGASRDASRAAGSARGAAVGAASLPTWTGPAAAVTPRPGPRAEPAAASPTTTVTTTTGTSALSDGMTAAPGATPTPMPSGGPTDPTGSPPGLGEQVLDRINAERAGAGCPALTVDEHLTEAAGAHAADMVARQYFDHTSPDGSTPSSRAAAAGYPGPVAENIATGYATADAVVDGWLDSSEHRANILDCDQRVMGIGQAPGSLPGYAPGTWVQLFGAG